MKIAIDWDTVVTTDVDLWSAFIKEAVFRGHHVELTAASLAKEMVDFGQHLDVVTNMTDDDVQLQEVMSADIWVHGRLDRVVSRHVAEHVLND